MTPANAPPSGADLRLLLFLLALWGAWIACGRLAGEPPGSAAIAARIAAHRVDVNRAAPDELAALPGVGPTLAARIAHTRGGGPFRSPADLRRVPGIGPGGVARLTPHVVFGGTEADP